ncbi:RNA polymerase sigma factor [Sinorhizobium sp. RAC02]|uniref:RNA polymerase sigma factor n=1 Tax=Sinorhizobium sp. RAC02 TaxID=1842534 RepID=UPI0009F61370|nr:RNA polymerase sigma factor [Sinorhizobium sp. RAC02]
MLEAMLETLAELVERDQEACERAITRTHLWNGEGRFESWIYTITRNLWIDEIRKRRVRTGSGTVDASEQDELLIEASGESAVYANQLQTMILSMPEGLASVFLLVNIEGHSYREAAGVLKIPIGTVMSRLSIARMRLAAMITETTPKFERHGTRPSSPGGSSRFQS